MALMPDKKNGLEGEGLVESCSLSGVTAICAL
jgi:hypothetical protein